MDYSSSLENWLDERAKSCLAPEVLRTKEVVHQKFSKAARQREGAERTAVRKAARTSPVAPAVPAIAASGSAASSSGTSSPRSTAPDGPCCFVQGAPDESGVTSSWVSLAEKVIMPSVQHSFYFMPRNLAGFVPSDY